MIETLARLEQAASEAIEIKPFGPYQEEVIIPFALDHPDFFAPIARFLKPDMFKRATCRLVVAAILNSFDRHGIVPTRKWLVDQLAARLTVDDPHEEIMGLIEQPSNPRDVPLVKETLLKWAKERAYGLLYSDEAVEAFHRGDFAYLEQVVNDANRIADVGERGFWFFENFEMLFQPDMIEHRTTGFPRLDRLLNNGGPSPKEVLCYLAATNVGKSLLLCNNAVTSLQGPGPGGQIGQDVLLITFELDAIKTAMRCLGAATDVPLNQIEQRQDFVRRVITQIQQTYQRRFCIYEFPPEECSVNHIYALLDSLKRREGWRPDVLILDYLDLMISRNPAYNKDDYTRQKHVATEIRGLAKNENLLIFTATQTNRSGAADGAQVDLTKSAESFGKQFPLDYVIGVQQSRSERQAIPARFDLHVAKNRNGPRGDNIHCIINYNTMRVTEAPL